MYPRFFHLWVLNEVSVIHLGFCVRVHDGHVHRYVHQYQCRLQKVQFLIFYFLHITCKASVAQHIYIPSASTPGRCVLLLVLVRAGLCLITASTLGGAVGVTVLSIFGGALVSTLRAFLGAAVGFLVGVSIGVAVLATLVDVLGAAAGFVATLRDGAVFDIAGFDPVAFLPVAVSNISTNFFNDATFSSQMLNGDAGAGLFNAAMRSRAACVAASAEFTPGIQTVFRKIPPCSQSIPLLLLGCTLFGTDNGASLYRYSIP